MTGDLEKPGEKVSKPQQVEVLQRIIAVAVRQVDLAQQTYYRWRKPYAGMGRSQFKRVKELEKPNQRLGWTVSDLTSEKLVITDAMKGNYKPLAPSQVH